VRILIVRTSALGDVVHALPVLTALRRALPEAKLAWAVEESIAPLLDGHPDLDEIMVGSFRRWGRQPLTSRTRREVLAFRRRLRSFQADVALDLMGNHKAGTVAFFSGARRRLGARRRQRREPSSALWIDEPLATSGPHAVDHGLSLLAGLGLDPAPADFGAHRILPHVAAAPINKPFVLIHPGAAWGNKRYPPPWWGEVAHRLASRIAVRVAIAPGEENLAEAVVATSQGGATLVAAPNLPSLVSQLRAAQLVLGGDTGPLHLAHALGSPVLMLLGPTDPERTGPYNSPRSFLAHPLPCSFCHRRFTETKACLLEIRPAQVVERALELLATPERSS
jgi:heptosyltransferase I